MYRIKPVKQPIDLPRLRDLNLIGSSLKDLVKLRAHFNFSCPLTSLHLTLPIYPANNIPMPILMSSFFKLELIQVLGLHVIYSYRMIEGPERFIGPSLQAKQMLRSSPVNSF